MRRGDGMYQERAYRGLIEPKELYNTTVIEKETDLFIVSSNEFKHQEKVREIRKIISDYILIRPEFQTSLSPIASDEFAPDMIKHMISVSKQANVGPMAAVAGAVSQYLGEFIDFNSEIIIENGGDIYLKSRDDRIISIYAGESSFSNRVGIKIKSEDTPLGICTSAGKVGHSLSFGNTDAVVVISEDTLLADVTATSIGNIVKTKEDIRDGLEFGKSISGILGIVIIIDEELGAWGEIELVSI